jgi:[protein-PII] uridylyltransferase
MSLGPDGAESRRRRSAAMDDRLRSGFGAAAGGSGGLALVAVGGYGRSELAPRSDLDVVLVHDPGVNADKVAAIAEALWYPIWDEGLDLDHAVRDTGEMRRAAATDLRAAIGMLDLRHVAGDEQLSHTLRSAALSDWRRDARRRLPDLRAAGHGRAERFGELADAAVPDLKESVGGLRDGVVLRALVATWLVDVPHAEAEGCRAELLDIRDALHEVAGRRTNRLPPELLPDLAEALAASPDRLARHVRALGRRVSHLSHVTWRRIDQVLERPRPAHRPDRPRTRRPGLVPLGRGVARVGGEAVLAADATPADDAALSLRVAALAAEHRLLVAPATAARLARSTGPLPSPWSREMRRQFVRLLAAGPALPPVWEELDQAGVVQRWLPEWDRVRHLLSQAPVHRFTVDRHSVQACVEAAALLRGVPRADLLVVATLLHDIGKGEPSDHSVVGSRIARTVATRMGFEVADVDRIAALVRWHLLLPEAATRRDLDDPVTVEAVADRVGDPATLELLAALTEADARATAPTAWSTWRAGLIRSLVAGCAARLGDVASDQIPDPRPALPIIVGHRVAGHPLRLDVAATDDGSRITVVGPDRTGLLADVAGALAWSGCAIRGGRADTVDGRAVSEWDVGTLSVDPARLAQRLRRVVGGDVDLWARLPAIGSDSDEPARVECVATASSATVLEVRAQDQRGLLWRACRALADAGVSVRSAHVDTLGPQAVDAFYLIGASGHPLSEADRRRALAAVRDALGLTSREFRPPSCDFPPEPSSPSRSGSSAESPSGIRRPGPTGA